MHKKTWHAALPIKKTLIISCIIISHIACTPPTTVHANTSCIPDVTEMFRKTCDAILRKQPITEFDVLAIDNYMDKKKETLLHKAVRAGNLPATEMLIRHKFDVNHPNNLGTTPLDCAINQSSPEMVKLLVQAGAHYNIEDNSGYTPLDYVKIMTRHYSSFARLSPEYAHQYGAEAKRLSDILIILTEHKKSW